MATSRPVSLAASETQPRCRICASPRREEIDALLSRLGEQDEALGRITLGRIVALVPKLDGGKTTSLTAMKRHRARHSVPAEAPADGEAPQRTWMESEERMAVVEELNQFLSLSAIPASAAHAVTVRLHLIELRDKLARGERVPVTIDQAGRAAQALAKDDQERETAFLLSALAGGISQVFERALGPGSEPAEELIEGAVEDAELVEVEEEGAGRLGGSPGPLLVGSAPSAAHLSPLSGGGADTGDSDARKA
jgi:hypothetical protein